MLATKALAGAVITVGDDEPGTQARLLQHYGGRRSWLVSAVAVIAGLGLWQALATFHILAPALLPSIPDVLRAAASVATQGYQGVTLMEDVGVSLLRVGLGFAAAVCVGVPLGLLVGMSRFIESAVDPYIQFLRPLPPLGYYTLLIVWFGIGDASKIILLFLTGLPIITVSSAAGVRAVDRDMLLAMSSLGLKGFALFRFVVLPACLPAIFTGLRLALGATFGSLVAAELIAAESGLGWLILTASNYVRTGIVFAGIIVIGLIALALDQAVVQIERRLVPWAGRA